MRLLFALAHFSKMKIFLLWFLFTPALFVVAVLGQADAAFQVYKQEEKKNIACHATWEQAKDLVNVDKSEDRHLQTAACTANDIADALVDDFGNFTVGKGFVPVRARCSNAQDNCPLTLITYTNDSLTEFDTSTIDQPCVTCDFYYCNMPWFTMEQTDKCAQNGGSLTAAECENVTCSGDVTCLPPLEDENATSSQVTLCTIYDRTDSFAIVEAGFYDVDGYRYLCRYTNEKRTFSQEYLTTVTNVRTTSMTLTNEVDDDGDNRFDICDYTIDGQSCNSCTVCEVDDIGIWAVDCSNIFPNATSSCDSFDDLVFSITDIARKWFVYQEGFRHTESPTASPTTDMPTEASPTPPPVSRGGGSGARGVWSRASTLLTATVAAILGFAAL